MGKQRTLKFEGSAGVPPSRRKLGRRPWKARSWPVHGPQCARWLARTGVATGPHQRLLAPALGGVERAARRQGRKQPPARARRPARLVTPSLSSLPACPHSLGSASVIASHESCGLQPALHCPSSTHVTRRIDLPLPGDWLFVATNRLLCRSPPNPPLDALSLRFSPLATSSVLVSPRLASPRSHLVEWTCSSFEKLFSRAGARV